MVAEKPEQPVPPVLPAPEQPAQLEAVAEVASRSKVAGWPSCCSKDEAKRLDLTLNPMLN